jgi:lipopolysaccharide transport system permease protein
MDQISTKATITHIGSGKIAAGISLTELWAYRDFLYFLVIRSMKARYAQSVLGFAWALIQPLFYMGVFSLIFGYFIGLSGGKHSYALFALAGIVPWSFFAAMVQDAAQSITKHRQMVTKVYVPRLLLPLAECLSRIFDFLVGLALLLTVQLLHFSLPGPALILLPVFGLWLLLLAFGLGMGLAAMSVRYRDVKYGLPFLLQMLFFASPIVYDISLIPELWHSLYAINPLVGIIHGFRCMFLRETLDLFLLIPGLLSTLVLLVLSLIYFQRKQARFADWV